MVVDQASHVDHTFTIKPSPLIVILTAISQSAVESDLNARVSTNRKGDFTVNGEPAGQRGKEIESALILFEDRLSDSPLIERVWRCHSERGGKFVSAAASHFEMALTKLRGKIFLTLRGPET